MRAIAEEGGLGKRSCIEQHYLLSLAISEKGEEARLSQLA
jgi:hypothetical protein